MYDNSRQKVEETIAKFQMELKRNSSSSKALYGLAMALDRLAEIKQSNIKLQESIEAYVQFLKNGGNVSDHIYQVAGERCINRMRFKGNSLLNLERVGIEYIFWRGGVTVPREEFVQTVYFFHSSPLQHHPF